MLPAITNAIKSALCRFAIFCKPYMRAKKMPGLLQRMFFALTGLVCCTTAQLWAQKAQQQEERWVHASQKIENLLRKLDEEYMETVDFNKAAENAITGILKELDPHSVYIPAEEYDEVNEPLVGNFEGIGIKFDMLRDTIFVLSIVNEGPSEKAGILPGDKIIAVNSKVIAGVQVSDEEIDRLLRGPKNSELLIDIKRNNQPQLLHYKVVRDKVTIPSIEAAYMVTPEIGYVKVNRFSANTMREFTKTLRRLKKEGMQALMLDLRNNGGGYFSTAIDMADEFLENNRLVVYTEGKNYGKRSYEATPRGNFEEGRLVVLMNERSASASEIVAGAIQDWDRGLIIGQRSYGKGLVQKPFMFSDSSYVRLTIAHYYTPTGRSIQKPYNSGKDAYFSDIETRYENGEMTSGITNYEPADTVKYLTKLNKRVVYGGGGISPDVFVPVDTAYRTAYYRQLTDKGILNKFMIAYLDDKRTELLSHFPAETDFENSFEVSDDLLQQLTEYAQQENLPPDDVAGFQTALAQIKLHIQSFLAKYLYSAQLSQKIVNRNNDTYLKALEVLQTNSYWNSANPVARLKQ